MSKANAEGGLVPLAEEKSPQVSPKAIFLVAILIIGFSGLIAQTLLLRELLVSFYGNELTVGIILANWVFLEAIGALLLGRLIDRIRRRLLAFCVLNIVFLFGFFLCLYLARTFKVILNVPSGLGLGINTIFWSSFLILLPVSFTHGGLFSFCVKIYASSPKYVEGQAVGRVYFWEMLGTILAGIIFTYLFIPHLDSFQIVFVILFLNLIILWFLFTPLEVPAVGGASRFAGLLLTGFRKFTPAIFIVCLIFLSPVASDWLQNSSIKLQWRNFEVLDYANSIYGNIVVTQRQGQYTFFSNGLPAITTPYPDLIFIEEFAKIPLLLHPRPKNILVISGGAGGLINEILEFPAVEVIDYVELDPLILNMLKKYPTDLTRRELKDPRVKTINLDGRFFIKKTHSRYDLIYLGLSVPSDLQANRLFTQEFFGLAKNRLNKEGILAFTLSGSTTYLAADLRDLNACILNSLKNIFSYVRVIPGDFNLFLASDSVGIIEADSNFINQRIKTSNIKTNLLLPGYVEYRLHKRFSNWFNDTLKDATKRTNRDFSGFALFKTLSLWNAQFSPGWQRIFINLEKVNLGIILGLIVCFFLLSLFLFRGMKRFRLCLPYAIASTGFFGMLINLIIIFSFQVVYGYLYFQITMLISLFMLGAALGSILVSRHLERINKPLKLLVGLEAGIILWIFITLFIILSYPRQFIFFLLCAITGFWVGGEFPLANRIYLSGKGQGQIGRTVGVIYAADLLGGWFAAVLSGILFLPILGLTDTCIVIFCLKIISLVFLTLAYSPSPLE